MEQETSPDQLLKSFRKKPLFDIGDLPVQFNYGPAEIMRVLPHRSPLLFVDQLTGLDLDQGLIAGARVMNAADPVFAGHFPDFPVYPGNFTIEMIGQLGLCMYYFINNQRTDIDPAATPMQLRATKIAGALFLEPILPTDHVTLLAKKISSDAYFGSMIGQAIVRGKVAVVTIGEVMIL